MMQTKNRKFHLPDCPSVAVVRKDCDCGTPPHPLGGNRALVKRQREGDKVPRLVDIPKSKLKSGEKDYS